MIDVTKADALKNAGTLLGVIAAAGLLSLFTGCSAVPVEVAEWGACLTDGAVPLGCSQPVQATVVSE
jgi:hypothetical protein